ncbi:MAG TPA: zinc-ribbon domain-containing protein [Kofleriaceae bacterium]|nr:zinc-ribbon domain-containing protein [Kofleriaceae bacterium]
MDVRCEKCGTEYELEEARLKPGGVTVKCTNCGHMFKIRKRAPTNVGATPPPEITRPRASSTGVPLRAPTADSTRQRADSGRVLSSDGGDRLWIIRFDNGEQKTCKELATLQQWIVSGQVSRESMISRTGKTWKRLGDIAELSSFFIVADEARQQRMGRDTGRVTAPVVTPPTSSGAPEPLRTTQVGLASGPKSTKPKPVDEVTQAAVPRSLAEKTEKTPLPSTTATGLPPMPGARPPTGAPPSKLGALPATPPGAKATVPATPAARAPSPISAAPPVPKQSTPPPLKSNMPVPPSERSTGAWANADVKPMVDDRSSGEWVAPDDVKLDDDSAGPRGPIAGKIAAIPEEPMFTASSFANASREARASDAPFARGPQDAAPRIVFDDDDSEPIHVPRGGGAGKWIALASIVVIGVASAAIYFGVIRGGGGGSGSASGSASGTGTGTGSVAVVPVDAKPAQPPPPVTPDAAPAPTADDPIATARDALLADVGAKMDDAQKALAADESKPGALALEARLIAARAQQLEDQSALETDKKIAADLHKQSQQKLLDAVRFAQRAIKAAPADVTAAVSMADILRLQGKAAKDVNRYLAPGLAAKDRDARLVSALLQLRDGKREPARGELTRLDDGDGAMEKTGDVRPRFRRAMIAFASGDGDTAKQLANDVLGVQPAHAGAKALLARVTEKVASGDPLPPEDHVDAGVPGPGTGAGTGTGTGTGSAGNAGDMGYDAALAKANKLAEDGDCAHAMDYYDRALLVRATSVEAQTGKGYCHLDLKQFSSAFSAFRSALSISPKYERALWGIAEGYQQQGLTVKAIEAYQTYLEAYPDSAAAKKQLERLGAPAGGGGGSGSASGGGSASGSSDSGSGSSAPPPPPPPGSDSGSGSGSASGNDPFGSGSGS